MEKVNLLNRRSLWLAFTATAVLLAQLAFAHTATTKLVPAADSTVTSPPAIEIAFNAPLEPKFSSISVTSATGHVVNKEQSVTGADNKSMTLKLPALTPGVYTVNWVAVSVDTHRIQGSYKFTVK